MKNISRKESLWYTLSNRLKHQAEYSMPVMSAFGVFGIINYPVFYFFWRSLASVDFTELTMRIIAALLCIPLIFKKYWPQKLKSILPLYWYLTVLYCLPFFGTFLFLKAHASNAWMINIILGLFWLIMILDWASFAIILPLGSLCACVFYRMTEGAFHLAGDNLAATLVNVVWVILTSLIFARNKAKIESEKLQSLSALSATIAHELRTPLRSIQSAVSGLKTYLPALLESYQAARAAKLSVPEIDPFYFKRLESIPRNVDHEARSAFTFIDMLLYKISRTAHQSETPLEICSMVGCVNEALERYPFLSHEESLINWEPKGDFRFKGNPLMMEHILFNLIKNALYYIEASGKGEIYIWLEQVEKKNTLHFKDTGPGIPSALLPNVFERFFSRRKHGTGMGLAFCKSAMQEISGDIQCRSKEGEYTEFILSFPVQSEKE